MMIPYSAFLALFMALAPLIFLVLAAILISLAYEAAARFLGLDLEARLNSEGRGTALPKARK